MNLIQTLEAGQWAEFEVTTPLFCPYHNRWGEPAYRFSGSFEHRPLGIHGSSTSGSPLIEDALGRLVGVADVASAEPQRLSFAFDGRRLRVENEMPGSTSLFVASEPAEGGRHWRDYNAALARVIFSNDASLAPPFWEAPEYCTWVEQKWEAAQLGGGVTPHEVLNDDFVDRYLEAVDRLGLPPGKLTIDHGWQDGDETYGDWDAHPQRFADLQKTAERIKAAGFVPGIWLAPIWLHPASRAASAYPESVGGPIVPSNADSPNRGGWNYWLPTEALASQMQQVLGRLYGQGFRKFKFDMIYGPMHEMIELHRVIYEAAKSVAPDAEIETHHPNPYFARYTDVVRTNDVLCHDRQAWRELTREHFEVCDRSAFGKVINLDHIGGNDPAVRPEDFLEHLSFYQQATGYPVVSLLPSHIGGQAVEAVRQLMVEREARPRARSRFISQPEP